MRREQEERGRRSKESGKKDMGGGKRKREVEEVALEDNGKEGKRRRLRVEEDVN